MHDRSLLFKALGSDQTTIEFASWGTNIWRVQLIESK
jgi:hypothetical protein